ncbi:MAG: hypothetical protein CSA26_07230 [Desulfobacterales bacterium]|nr:MAG: hypothetical protein CSA26_07230 [Desulfobacterales bacterium]
MNLTTRSQRPVLRPFGHDFSLFDDFFTPFSGGISETRENTYLPSVDIYEQDEKLCIEAELPGFDKKEIKVDVKGNFLTLGGERFSNKEVNENNRFRKERRYGKFERTFRLPFEATGDQIKATYRDGVLTLIIEKPEEQKPKQITID